MTDRSSKLTVDEAMAAITLIAKERLESAPPAEPRTVADTFEAAEARLFQTAQQLLVLACPDPRHCCHHRCRRHRLCRHFVVVRAVQSGARVLPQSRRSPGAWALRYAVWVYMNTLAR